MGDGATSPRIDRRAALWGAASAVVASAASLAGGTEAAAHGGGVDNVTPDGSKDIAGTVIASSSDALALDLGDGADSLTIVPASSAQVVDHRGEPVGLASFAVGDEVSLSVEADTSAGGAMRAYLVTPAVLGRRSDVSR